MWDGGRDVIPYKCGPISSSLIAGHQGSEVSSLPRNRTAVNRPPTLDGGFPSRPPLDRRRRLPSPFPRRSTIFFPPLYPSWAATWTWISTPHPTATPPPPPPSLPPPPPPPLPLHPPPGWPSSPSPSNWSTSSLGFPWSTSRGRCGLTTASPRRR